MKKRLLLAAAILVNTVVGGAAWAAREYEAATRPDGSPVIVCEFCFILNCDCPPPPRAIST
jgi:hypothetical protein